MTGTPQPGPGRLAGHEIEREARRVFRRLAAEGACLAEERGSSGSRLTYRLMVKSGKRGRRTSVTVRGDFVGAFCREGWLAEEETGVMRLTPDGRAWLARQLDADPFRQQHQLWVETTREAGGVPRSVVVNEAESPLGWLRRRKDKTGAPLITEFQYKAGERLRSDFWRAHMTPHVTSNWNSPAPSRRMRRSSPDQSAVLTDHVLAAKQRVLRALAAVGPELSGILIDVCCHLQGLAEVEQDQGWPQRSAKVILQIALTGLARHYGLVSDAVVAEPVTRRLRHWGAGDYKPNLQAWK